MDIDYSDTDIMDEDITDITDIMEEDYTIYNVPKTMNIKGSNFTISKYSGRVEDYDINRSNNEIVFPLRLETYNPIKINEKNNKPIEIEAAIFFLHNVINKINNKYNKDVIKTLIREDIIHINLDKGTINMHTYGIIKQIDKIDKSMIFLPIGITTGNSIGHFNILVINNNIKKITLYEPLGIFGLGRENTLSNVHRERLMKSFNYIRYEVLKKYSEYEWRTSYKEGYMTQQKSNIYQIKTYKVSEVYCVAWCLYLCLFRIFNIHLKTDLPAFVILEETYKELLFTDEDVNIFIRRFVSLIYESTDYYEENKRDATFFYGFDNVINIDNYKNLR